MRVKMSIELKNIDKSKNRVWYNYYVTTAIRKYFDFKSVFFIEYDIDISSYKKQGIIRVYCKLAVIVKEENDKPYIKKYYL